MSSLFMFLGAYFQVADGTVWILIPSEIATAGNVVRISFKGGSSLINECNMSRLNAWKYHEKEKT